MFTRLIIHNMSQKVLFLSTLPSIRVLSGRPCDSPSLLSGWWNPSGGWEEEDDDGCDRLVDVNPPKDAQHMATFIKILKNRVFLPTVFRTCMYSHVFCVLHGTHVITLHRWGECLKSGLWTSVILKGYYYFQAFNKQKSLGVTEAISEHTHRVNGGHKDKWPGCNFTFASTQTEINEYESSNVSLGSRVAFVFSMLSEQTGKLHLAQECRAHGLTSYSLTTLMPRPPPPYAALKMMGKPYVSANACASCRLAMGASVPGTTGTPETEGW